MERTRVGEKVPGRVYMAVTTEGARQAHGEPPGWSCVTVRADQLGTPLPAVLAIELLFQADGIFNRERESLCRVQQVVIRVNPCGLDSSPPFPPFNPPP